VERPFSAFETKSTIFHEMILWTKDILQHSVITSQRATFPQGKIWKSHRSFPCALGGAHRLQQFKGEGLRK